MTSRLLGRPSTGAIPSGGLEIYWRGWLSKCGHRKKSWKQRFFVLSNRGGAAMEYVCPRRVLVFCTHVGCMSLTTWNRAYCMLW